MHFTTDQTLWWEISNIPSNAQDVPNEFIAKYGISDDMRGREEEGEYEYDVRILHSLGPFLLWSDNHLWYSTDSILIALRCPSDGSIDSNKRQSKMPY